MSLKKEAASRGKVAGERGSGGYQSGSSPRPDEPDVPKPEGLKGLILSDAAATEKPEQVIAAVKELDEAEVRKAMEDHVPHVSFVLDRTGSTPVSDYIWMTYLHGLPIYRSNPVVQQHTIHALRYIFDAALKGTIPGASDALKRLAEAYQSCQAEQGRTIDDLYGKLSGRDASLKDQVLALVDLQKSLTMEAVVHKLNPNAAKTDDRYPSQQAPHITSAYLEAVGKELGMRGVAAASIDENRPRPVNRQAVLQAFYEQFSMEELDDALVGDVNQQAPDAERRIDRDLLAKWALEEEKSSSGAFDKYCIYFNEEKPEEYEGRPCEGGEYQPFLNRQTARTILLRLFQP